MKYIAGITLAMMVNSEIFTLLVLSVMGVMFLSDILKERVGG